MGCYERNGAALDGGAGYVGPFARASAKILSTKRESYGYPPEANCVTVIDTRSGPDRAVTRPGPADQPDCTRRPTP
jgi:hypothetical protein